MAGGTKVRRIKRLSPRYKGYYVINRICLAQATRATDLALILITFEYQRSYCTPGWVVVRPAPGHGLQSEACTHGCTTGHTLDAWRAEVAGMSDLSE